MLTIGRIGALIRKIKALVSIHWTIAGSRIFGSRADKGGGGGSGVSDCRNSDINPCELLAVEVVVGVDEHVDMVLAVG